MKNSSNRPFCVFAENQLLIFVNSDRAEQWEKSFNEALADFASEVLVALPTQWASLAPDSTDVLSDRDVIVGNSTVLVTNLTDSSETATIDLTKLGIQMDLVSMEDIEFNLGETDIEIELISRLAWK